MRLNLGIITVTCFLSIVNAREIFHHFLTCRDENLSKNCVNDLKEIRRGIKHNELWAMKIEDSSGKVSAEFIDGNNFWLGSQEVCERLNHPIEVPLPSSITRRMSSLETSVKTKVPVDYRIIFASHSSPFQFHSEIFNFVGLHIGLCLPESCNQNDIDVMGNSVFSKQIFNEKIFGRVQYKSSKNLKLRENFFDDPWVITLIMISSFFTIFTIISCFKNFDICNGDKFLRAFSIGENVKKLFAMENDENSFLSLNGLRFLFTLWMIIAHSNLYTFGAVDNLQFAFTHAGSWLIQPVFATFIAVETFFVLSGFLVAFSHFNNLKQKKTLKNSLMSTISRIIMRFIRYNIGFSVILIISKVVGMFINDTTKFLLVEDLELTCKEFGWRNFLLIQNMFPFAEVCVSWSWYIAADFQLFTISNVLLWIYGRNEKMGKYLFYFIFVMSSICCGFLGLKSSFTFSIDKLFSTISEIYYPFYMHISSYFIGIFTGFYLSENDRILKISKNFMSLLWLLCIASILSMTFLFHYGRAESFFVSFLFPAVGRGIWSLCISFFILATCSQYGKGPITSLWNSKIFLPLGRFSFSAYILNPLIVLIFVLSSERAYHYDLLTSTIMTTGFILTTYFFALLFILIFEMPITNLVALLLNRKSQKLD